MRRDDEHDTIRDGIRQSVWLVKRESKEAAESQEVDQGQQLLDHITVRPKPSQAAGLESIPHSRIEDKEGT